MMKYVWLIALVAVPFHVSLAQTAEEFLITQRITTPDPIPPSTPVITSVTPVSDTQIDVVWAASTDNIGVVGYQVFRDLTKVATTSLTTFSDTGLTPSTTYSYTVVAFDALRNYSTSSAAVATTTLTPPPPPPPAPTSTVPTSTADTNALIGVVPKLSGLTIDAGTTMAGFIWETNRGLAYELRWGRTSDYELGFVASDRIARAHQTTLTGLVPGTMYQYELVAVDNRGRKVSLESGSFATESLIDRIAPANVSAFVAREFNAGVTLSWNNPVEDDFAFVRIVRSHLFFPTDPAAGFLVYEGSATEAFDAAAFQFGDVAYYTAFAYDESGNISSGAVTFVQLAASDGAGTTDAPTLPAWDTSTTVPAVVLVPGSDGAAERILRLSDIYISQADTRVSLDTPTLRIDGEQPLTLSIPYRAVPQHLKSLLVEFAHPDRPQETFVFLLRINPDGTAYEATIAPLEFGGLMPVRVLLFDFATQAVYSLQTVVAVDTPRGPVRPDTSRILTDNMPAVLLISGLLLLLLILLLLRYWLGRQGED